MSLSEESSLKAHIVIPLWSIMVWLVLMNTSMFNIVLPTVIVELNISPVAGSWIITAYSAALAISTVTYSRLSDFIPIRKLLLFGMILFGTASILGFLANHYVVLLTARVVQAIGAGVSQALGIVIAAKYVPLARRGRSMALIAAAASFAFGLGPVVGGVIAQSFGWNFLFLVTCFVFILLPILYKHTPMEKQERVTFDFLGGSLLAIGTVSLLIFLTTLHFLYLIASLIAYVLFWKHIQKVKTAFIQPELLKNYRYLMLLFIGFSAFALHFATLFFLPLLLFDLFQKEAIEIGLIIFPGAMLSALNSILIGRLIDRFGTKSTMIGGNVLLLLSTLLFAFILNISPSLNLVAYLFMSLGFFTLTASVQNELTRLLPASQIGSGVGVLQLMNFFGISFGVTIAGILITIQSEVTKSIVYKNVFLIFSGLGVLSVAILFTYLTLNRKKKHVIHKQVNDKVNL